MAPPGKENGGSTHSRGLLSRLAFKQPEHTPQGASPQPMPRPDAGRPPRRLPTPRGRPSEIGRAASGGASHAQPPPQLRPPSHLGGGSGGASTPRAFAGSASASARPPQSARGPAPAPAGLRLPSSTSSGATAPSGSQTARRVPKLAGPTTPLSPRGTASYRDALCTPRGRSGIPTPPPAQHAQQQAAAAAAAPSQQQQQQEPADAQQQQQQQGLVLMQQQARALHEQELAKQHIRWVGAMLLVLVCVRAAQCPNLSLGRARHTSTAHA